MLTRAGANPSARVGCVRDSAMSERISTASAHEENIPDTAPGHRDASETAEDLNSGHQIPAAPEEGKLPANPESPDPADSGDEESDEDEIIPPRPPSEDVQLGFLDDVEFFGTLEYPYFPCKVGGLPVSFLRLASINNIHDDSIPILSQ